MNYDISNDTNFKIIKFEKKYLSDIINLFSISYQKTKPKPYFEYNLSPSPKGIPIRFLMKHKQTIVGSHSIRPVLFYKDNLLIFDNKFTFHSKTKTSLDTVRML